MPMQSKFHAHEILFSCRLIKKDVLTEFERDNYSPEKVQETALKFHEKIYNKPQSYYSNNPGYCSNNSPKTGFKYTK